VTTALTTTNQQTNGFGLIMNPATIEGAKDFCRMLAATAFVPKAFRGNPDSIMVVGAMGARLGVDVFTAMSGIADINGKPAIYGDLMLAVCQNHPAFADCIEVFDGKPYEDGFRAVCTAVRKGREPVVRSFSVLEAKEAGLWKKQGPWTSTPQRMLQMRARAFALRDTFADGLAGFHAREELEDLVDVTATSTVLPEPSQAKVRELPAAVIPPPAPVEPPASSPAEMAPGAGAPPARDVSVEVLHKAATALWKKGSAGKAAAAEILQRWSLKEVAELAGADATTRGEFLDEIEKAAGSLS